MVCWRRGLLDAFRGGLAVVVDPCAELVVMGLSLCRLARTLCLAASLILILGPALAPAGAVVRYSFTSDPVGPHGVFSGFIEFDEVLQLPNATIPIAEFTDWDFAWGGAFTYDPTSHAFDPALSMFVLGPALEVSNATSLCVGPLTGCSPLPPQHPFFALTDSSVSVSFGISDEDVAVAEGSWSFAVVSEPGTLALFALGVALILFSQVGRRRRGKDAPGQARRRRRRSSLGSRPPAIQEPALPR